ncbi:GmrSD restriction endonuclease domain-containing protein [Maricaulis sp. CAU 1757]
MMETGAESDLFEGERELPASDINEDDLVGVTRESISKTVLYPTDWTVGVLLDLLKRKKIDLSPHFQRRVAWDAAKMSKFIESIFLQLPVPQIVLAETRPGRYSVIDGKQRLTALARFCLSDMDSPSLKLKGCEYVSEVEGRSFQDIKSDPQLDSLLDAFESTTIRTVVIKNYPSKEILYLMFLRLNQNSVTLSPQELRKALFPGEFYDWLDDWTSSSKALGFIFSTVPDFRMRDIEVTLRHIAFQLFAEQYSGNIKKFLDDASDQLTRSWSQSRETIERVVQNFELALTCTNEIFGDNAFKVYEAGEYKKAPNRAVIDIMTHFFADPNVREEAMKNRDRIVRSFEDLSGGNSDFRKYLQSSTKTNEATFGRFQHWRHALQEIVESDIPAVAIPEKR